MVVPRFSLSLLGVWSGLTCGMVAGASPDWASGRQNPASGAALPTSLVGAEDPVLGPREAALEEAFQRLEQQWLRVEAAWESRATPGRSSNGAPTRAEDPSIRFRRPFEKLARAGCAPASLWSLVHFRRVRGLGTSVALSRVELDEREALYGHLFQGRTDDLGFLEAGPLDLLEAEADLSSERVRSMLQSLAFQSENPEVSALALLVLGQRTAPLGSTDARAWDEARDLYEEILVRFADTQAAQGADEELWRLQNLTPGCVAPDFLTHDLAGNEVHLSDFRGQVVVVHFSASDSDDPAAALALAETFSRRYWDARFTWVGVHRGGERTRFQLASESSLLSGQLAWEGGCSSSASTAWKVPGGAATYVLDPSGQVVAVNPDADALTALVDTLLQGLRDKGRARRSTLQTPSRSNPPDERRGNRPGRGAARERRSLGDARETGGSTRS